LHRRRNLWGPGTLKFDLERFLDERHRKYCVLFFSTLNPFIFLPFDAGLSPFISSRPALPSHHLSTYFAYNEASFFLVRLLQ
ncbi:hypothetical protein DFH07DRAFT_695576, partial [Mycena maculata]